MGQNCCVYACKTNYSSAKLKSDKISKYRFPKDETEKERCIKSIPTANLRVTKDTVVCTLHWLGFEEIKHNGNLDRKTRLDLARCTIYSSTNIISTTTTHKKRLF